MNDRLHAFGYNLEADTLVIGREGTEYTVTVKRKELMAWQGGKPAQEAFPDLTADQREFLISGLTPEEFETLFCPSDYEDYTGEEG